VVFEIWIWNEKEGQVLHKFDWFYKGLKFGGDVLETLYSNGFSLQEGYCGS
jgi:hypothetical protein